jgi:hypothetical protein
MAFCFRAWSVDSGLENCGLWREYSEDVSPQRQ